MHLQPVGQKTPRVDLYLPSLHTIIEVKYRKDAKKSSQNLIGEIAEDASLYHSDLKFEDARIVSFLWDSTRATQEHAKFKEGVSKIDGVKGCVVISAPSKIKKLALAPELQLGSADFGSFASGIRSGASLTQKTTGHKHRLAVLPKKIC